MKIDLLNLRISILKNETVTDSIGNHTSQWSPYYSCYATLSSEGGKEMTDAGTVIDDSTLDLTIRFCDKVKAIDSTHYRVEMNDTLYNIEGVDHMNNKRKTIKLRCRRERR